MGRFFPIYVRRSDGKMNLVNRHRMKEKNEPTPDQLDRKPDANGIVDYYRVVDMDEQKHLDWRRKLGGMLARDLGHSDSERGYMLVAFPEHYRLYEHVVKRVEDDSKVTKTVKNHAGGNNDRQDAYLYGHPLGRKKRYRSPADFYHHLLWLAMDETGDPDNCACKICCSEEVDDKSIPAVKKEVKQETKQEGKRTSIPDIAQRSQVPAGQQPSFGSEGRPAATQSAQGENRAVQRQPTVSVVRPVSQSSPALLTSNPRNEDQRLDLLYGTSMFRQGELVWFSRVDRWGLGIVLQRWFQDTSGTASPAFTIQPLSHPFSHPPLVTVTSQLLLRPWLAWSVPNFSHKHLNDKPITYDSADWHGMHNKQYGEGDMEVDGSILAAKAIDVTFSPFDPIPSTFPPGTTSFNGLYLGAERIWLGDALRLTSNNDILVLRSIIETVQAGGPSPPSLVLAGEVYAQTQLRASDPLQPLPPSLPLSLPAIITQDLKKRNPHLIRAKGVMSSYVLARPSASFTTADVRGRWYPASLLGPIVLPDKDGGGWSSLLARGEGGDMGSRMNARLDSVKNGRAMEVRKATREEAWGKAVPAGTRVGGSAGITRGPALVAGRAGSVHQQQQQQQQRQQHGGGGGGQDGLDEFMNLDG